MANQQAVREALVVAVGQCRPVLLWGDPGTGKSAVVREMALSLGLRVEVVVASLREPSDFAGLPIVDGHGQVRLAPPAWASRLSDAMSGVLFLDEISTAPPAVQAALLRVVLERVVGDIDLPPGIAIVAAANPAESSAGAWDLTAPLANRFCHLDWPVDPTRYAESLMGGWPSAVVGDDPGGDSARMKGLVAGFLRARPALVLALPKDMSGAGRGWPSPRTWDMAIDLWASATRRKVSLDAQLLLLSGCVGPGTARELFVWTQEADLPDPEEVLADPARFRLPDRGDRQFAVLSAITAAVAANPTATRWEAAFEVIEQAVSRGASDIAAVAARGLAECAPPGLESLPATLTTLAPVLGKAGLLRRKVKV